MLEAAFFSENRRRFADIMEDGSVLVLFSGKPPRQSADAYYAYHANRNFYYMTGVARQEAVLVISKNSAGVREVLFIPDPARIAPGSDDYALGYDEAKCISGISEVVRADAFVERFHALIAGNRRDGTAGSHCCMLYADLDRIRPDDPPGEGAAFAVRQRELYPFLGVADAFRPIADMRRVKAEPEIEAIRRAVRLTGEGIDAILKTAAPGKGENDLEAAFRAVAIRAGERELGFPPIIASGKNALLGHYGANSRPLEDGALVLLDLGCNADYYSADVSRAFPANGKFSGFQRALYGAVLRAHKEILAELGPGEWLRENREKNTARIAAILGEAGFSAETHEGFWCFGGVDHYLGLDTHDVGMYDAPFAPGMVVTVDSAVRLPSLGVAFRIEDDILIIGEGNENLSALIPVEIEEIEAAMWR